ncbi:MAG: dTMP kinase [Planctomycetota bacterium]|jgi:dTMP kinase|nr:dTMP kinase [Planctomycetota bacterium]
MFLVLEGIDGAGKSRQIELLVQHFTASGQTVRRCHFPRTESEPYGGLIAAFLRGEYGENLSPRLIALLYALDRREAAGAIREWLAAGELVIVDRYLHSNLAYQGAKLSDPGERQELLAWIENLEYVSHAIPRPDLAIFLDVPLDFAWSNLSRPRQGQDRGYLQGGEDIHEKDSHFQRQVRDVFLDLVREGKLARVDCATPGGGMAKPEAVHQDIINLLRQSDLLAR